MSTGFVFDSGALMALETPAKRRRLLALLDRAGEMGAVAVSAGCVAEVWRGSGRQAALALLLRRPATEVAEITLAMARAIGVYLSRQPDGDDIIDAHVVLLARQHGFAVVTSDAGDLLALDPGLAVISV